VLRAARGRGFASALMARLEAAAREMGLALLHLDTETDSDADRVYAHLGWTRMGVLPAYAGTPDGVLRDCSFWYRQLDAP
jgi:GNAT superfamily N-acetyltransferase